MADGDNNKFPILTRSMDTIESTTESSTARAPLARSVEQAMREVLGWRPKQGDAKGFVAALNRSFTCEEQKGVTKCEWTPRRGAMSVQADMGEITGAQASL